MIKWMTDSAILMRRHPDAEEEPDLIDLEVVGANGVFSLRGRFHCVTDQLRDFGRALSAFPASASDRPTFTAGAENAEDQFLSIAAYLDGARSALRCRFKSQDYFRSFEGEAAFSIVAEVAAINRLGALVQTFSKLAHSDLQWTPLSGELFVEAQREVI